ncbi:MAG: adaptor protein MecA [Desulfitobacteriaceae bacterium]
MRIQKVNERTIRIFISFTELADRDITMTDLFQRSPKTEQLFWELIAQAREEVEFNLDQPFWIQATVASNDEFVITVMKQEEQIEAPVQEKGKKKTGKGRLQEWVYVFADLEDSISAVTSLPQFTQLRSSLYEFENEYYLVLNRLGSGRKKQLAEAVLDEYGELVSITKAFLIEHGKTVLVEQAVETMKASFGPR